MMLREGKDKKGLYMQEKEEGKRGNQRNIDHRLLGSEEASWAM